MKKTRFRAFFNSQYFLLLRRFRDLPENFRLLDRQFREHFAVQANFFLCELADKPAVGDTLFSGRRVDPDVPELPEIALALFPAADSVHASMHHRFHCRAVIRLAVGYKALGALDYLFTPGPLLYASFDSGHCF